MKLTDLQKIVEQRTKGVWKQIGTVIETTRGKSIAKFWGWVPGETREKNAEFVVEIANHADEIMDVLWAARDLGYEVHEVFDEDLCKFVKCRKWDLKRLTEALEKLESK